MRSKISFSLEADTVESKEEKAHAFFSGIAEVDGIAKREGALWYLNVPLYNWHARRRLTGLLIEF